MDAGVVAPGGISPAGQRRQVKEAIDYIARHAEMAGGYGQVSGGM